MMPEITKKSQPPDGSLATDQVEDFSALDTHITPDDKFCGMKPPANPFMSTYLLMFIPGINFVFEFYNSSKPPSPDTLKEVLNMIVIVSTLLFAVVVTMPFGFQHDELVDYVNLWRKGGVYDGLAKEALEVDGYEFTEADYARPVTRFVGESVYATGLLFATLIVSIIMYVSLATASFRDADGKINVRMLGAWWSVARFALLMVLALLVSGIWYFQSAVYWAYDIKYPHFSCFNKMSNACRNGPSHHPLTFKFAEALDEGTISPGIAVASFGDEMLAISAFVAIGILGLATSFKTFYHFKTFRSQRQRS